MYFFTPTYRKPEFYIQAPQSPRPNPIYFTANTFGYIKVKKQDKKVFHYVRLVDTVPSYMSTM